MQTDILENFIWGAEVIDFSIVGIQMRI